MRCNCGTRRRMKIITKDLIMLTNIAKEEVARCDKIQIYASKIKLKRFFIETINQHKNENLNQDILNMFKLIVQKYIPDIDAKNDATIPILFKKIETLTLSQQRQVICEMLTWLDIR